MEKEYVYKVYDKIAPHFSSTRYKPWPMIVKHLESLETGTILADIGCGNGKYLGCNPNIYTIGIDRSYNLISCAKEKNKNH